VNISRIALAALGAFVAHLAMQMTERGLRVERCRNSIGARQSGSEFQFEEEVT
jgi:hypothetical protein